MISVCPLEHSIQICNKLGEDHSMYQFLDSNLVGARQAAETFYRINGAIYIQKTKMLMAHENLYNEKSYAYIMDKRHSIDIDDAFDFQMAEMVLGNYIL